MAEIVAFIFFKILGTLCLLLLGHFEKMVNLRINNDP